MLVSKSALGIAAGAALIIASAGCSSRLDAPAATPLQAQELPRLPHDAPVDPDVIRSRRPAALGQLSRLGSDVYQLDQQTAQLDSTQHACTLSPGPGAMSWAIYRFSDLVPEDTPLLLGVHLAGEQPVTPYYIGCANFATDRYEFSAPVAATPEGELALPAGAGAISPGGNVYVVVIAYDGKPLSLTSLALNLDCADPPPQGFSAEPGDGQLPVHLSWSDPAVSYDPDYEGPLTFDYDAVRIQRAETALGPWTEVGSFQAGITEFDDADAIGNPPEGGYYYHVMTLIGGNNIRWGGVIFAPILNLQIDPFEARFTLSPAFGDPGTNVTLDATGSTLGSGTLTKARWDFDGDGVWDESSPTSLSTTHTYAKAGRYYPRFELTVDDSGATHVDTVTGYFAAGDKRGDWHQEQRNAQHMGGTPLRGPKTNTVRGSYTGSGTFSAPAVAADGKVYVCESTGYLNVFNPDATLDHRVDLLSGGSNYPPALDRHGNIWLNVDNGGTPQLTCVFPDNTVHNYAASGMNGAPTVTLDGEYVLFAAGKTLYEASATPVAGDPGWYHKRVDFPHEQHRPAMSRDGYIYSLRKDGGYGGFSRFDAALFPIIVEKIVSAGAYYYQPVVSNTGYVYAVDSELIFGKRFVGELTSSGGLADVLVVEDTSIALAPPAFGQDGAAYVCSGGSDVYKYGASGGWTIAKYTLAGSVHPMTPPLVDGDGKVYIVTSAGQVLCLSSKLKFKWSYDLGSVPVKPGLALGNDGTLYAGGTNKLVAFK